MFSPNSITSLYLESYTTLRLQALFLHKLQIKNNNPKKKLTTIVTKHLEQLRNKTSKPSIVKTQRTPNIHELHTKSTPKTTPTHNYLVFTCKQTKHKA
jgi:hypothetical protein